MKDESKKPDFYIEKLELENFKCFESLSIELDPRFNIVIGENASGKTALLDGIKFALAPCVRDFLFSITPHSAIRELYPKGTGFHPFNFRRYKDTIVLKDGFVVSSDLEYAQSYGFSSIGNYMGKRSKWSFFDTGKENADLFNKIVSIKQSDLDRLFSGTYPVVATFNTNRLFPNRIMSLIEDDVPHRIKAVKKERAYRLWRNASSSKLQIEKWLEYRAYVRLEQLDLYGRSVDPYLELMNKMVALVLPGVKSIYYSIAHKQVCIAFEHEQRPFKDLSDGTQNLLGLFGDILWRCCTLNPHLLDKANESPGVVLIDELDLHLHPKWQRQVVGYLRDFFPNMQFVVTTHSPFVINSDDDAKCHRLVRNEAGKFLVEPPIVTSEAIPYTQVARMQFGIASDFGPDVEEKMNTFYRFRDRLLESIEKNTREQQTDFSFEKFEHKKDFIAIVKDLSEYKTLAINNRIGLELRQLKRILPDLILNFETL